MKFYIKKLGLTFFLLFFTFGCASGHCGRDGKPQDANQEKKKIFIYKYDGSKQCEEHTGTDIDDMRTELLGIKIFSMSKKSDGQMRVQVCGALTGKANVYEISAKDLSKAEALGFKKWNF